VLIGLGRPFLLEGAERVIPEPLVEVIRETGLAVENAVLPPFMCPQNARNLWLSCWSRVFAVNFE
jgi:hypothetical protein